MKRRAFLRGAAALSVVAMLATPALAADRAAESVMRQLRQLGYEDVGAARTLLGRTRITARRGAERREIVLDPRSGEILRDLSTGGVSVLGASKLGRESSRDDKTSGGSSSSGGDDSASGSDDGGDDRDDDDGSDDNSGSGNSGSDDSGGDDKGGDSDDDSGDDGGDSDDDD